MSSPIDLAKIRDDQFFPAFVRQLARDLMESSYGTAGKILSNMSMADLIFLKRNFHETMVYTENEGKPLFETYWFKIMGLCSSMILQSEVGVLDGEESIGHSVSMLNSFLDVMIMGKNGLLECKDIRRLSLASDFFETKYQDLLIAGPSDPEGSMATVITKMWDLVKTLRLVDASRRNGEQITPEGIEKLMKDTFGDDAKVKRIKPTIDQLNKPASINDTASEDTEVWKKLDPEVGADFLSGGQSTPSDEPTKSSDSSQEALEEKLRKILGKRSS